MPDHSTGAGHRVASFGNAEPLGIGGPLIVKPKTAWQMLSVSNTKGYELIAAGELDSFLDGRSRKITVASIYRYIEKCLQQEAA